MARTDIHRPSAPEFDPENYDLLGVFDLHPEPGSGAVWQLQERGRIINRALGFGQSFAGAPHPSGQCGHCGAHLRYAALMAHRPTGTLLDVGEECLDNRFSVSATEFAALRKAAAAQAAATREANRLHELDAEIIAWLADQDPRLAELSYRGNGGTVDANGFLDDVAIKLFRYGNLSDRQVDAVANAVTRDAERQGRIDARDAADAARQATAAPAPTGRVVVTGTVGATWTRDGDYGVQFKFRVTDDRGFVIISTIPAKLIDALAEELGPDVNVWAATDRLRGRRVSLTATLSPLDDDPTTAWAGRPAKPALVPA